MNLHLLLNRAECDYRCIFCTMGGEHHLADQAQILADFDWDAEWERIEQVLCGDDEDHRRDALHIMGNDPGNHPDILRTIQRASSLGYRKVVVETNGLRLADPAFANELVSAGARWFKIPVYGSCAQIHDPIVRRPGAFEQLTRALANLAEHHADVELHSLILKQNAADLPRCKFLFPLSFRYPFRHDRADFPYSHYAPRLSDVPRPVLGRSDLVIPCINGSRLQEARHEARFRPEAPETRDEDSNVTKRRPAKCSADSCADFAVCQGIFPAYFETYGEEEFSYRPEMQAVDSPVPTGPRGRLASLRDRATQARRWGLDRVEQLLERFKR